MIGLLLLKQIYAGFNADEQVVKRALRALTDPSDAVPSSDSSR